MDAAAFCEWLNKRDPEGMHYRLPNTGELSEEEIACSKEIVALFGKNRTMGYWVVSG